MSSYILMTNGSTESMINTLQGSIISMQNGTDLRVIFDVITELQDQAWDGDEKNRVDRWKSQLQDYISNIGSNFERLSQLIKKGKEAPAQDWDSFVNYTMENIEENVSPLQKKIFPGRKRPKGTGYIFDLALTSNDLRRKHCREALAMQSFLSHLFQTVMVTEAKAMLSLTYAILIQNSSYEARTYKLWQLTVDFKDRFNYYMVRTAEAMSIAPHQTTPCDPPNGTRIRDETYFEIERLEQVSVFQFSDTSNSRDCANAVEKKSLTFYSERDICKGSLSDCEYSGWLDVCRLENSSKRYEWIKSEGGDYGMNFDKCPSGTITKYEGNNNSSNGHCICKCREAGNWMSVSPVMANVSDNMVVIGSRFMRKEGVLYLQLKQGRLLANGWIDPSSQEWIPLPKNPVLMAINSTHNKFYLDNVPLPMGHVVVGE
ncbi:uncharacterized protein LOC107036872 [Diachasma alloeum]|uniref:uncharacterized protein LOC107036872 n=1 Tax=Diachasma alloeum TaxID=454923 RepID=UPI0007384098|nr:uncharacterized protein LOC107036872 [Diachasma alloeum]